VCCLDIYFIGSKRSTSLKSLNTDIRSISSQNKGRCTLFVTFFKKTVVFLKSSRARCKKQCSRGNDVCVIAIKQISASAKTAQRQIADAKPLSPKRRRQIVPFRHPVLGRPLDRFPVGVASIGLASLISAEAFWSHRRTYETGISRFKEVACLVSSWCGASRTIRDFWNL